jgi:predicted acetyltransferase
VTSRCELVRPSPPYLASYVAALERGWSPDNIRGDAAAREELGLIAADPDAFFARLVDREGKGPPIELPDGTHVPRLPGFRRWVWDGELCGTIGFRWQPGTSALPPYVLGHIGYAIVPWKRQRGYATRALALMLEEARGEGLEHVELTCDASNVASQRVIVANGGVLVEHFRKPAQYGGTDSVRYRIVLGVS